MEQQQKPITDDDSIQLIVKIFGISGVQLRRWNPKNRWILLNWWMNILLNVWFYYVIFIDQSSYFSIIKSQLQSSDQFLLRHLYIANHYLIWVTIHTGFMLWFIRYGHEMIEYLRSPIFNAQCSFIKMIAIIVISLIVSIMILMWNWILATLQLTSSTQYFKTTAIWLLIFFHQWKMWSTLNQIYEQNFSNNDNSVITIKRLLKIFKAIRKLSNFNDPIRKRFSWLLINQLLDNLSYLIADITYMISIGLDSLFGTVLALPLRLILWLKLCQMNNKILEQFDRIEYRLDRQIRKYQLNNHNNNNLDDNTLNILIKMKQIHRFRDSFRLWLFQNYYPLERNNNNRKQNDKIIIHFEVGNKSKQQTMNNKKQNTNRFLNLIVNTYGIGGVQLSPLKFNEIRSVVNFFTNILLNIYMVKTFQSPLFKNDETTKFEEYMLMQFNKFNAYILFPLIYYAYTLSYFINGHRLIECFQSTIYLSIQYSKQKSILILSIVMIIQNFIIKNRYCSSIGEHSKSTKFSNQNRKTSNLMKHCYYRTLSLIIKRNHLKSRRNSASIWQKKQWTKGKNVENHCSITNETCENLFNDIKNLANLNTMIQSIQSYLLLAHILDTSSFFIISTTYIAAFGVEFSYSFIIEFPLRVSLWIGFCLINRIVLAEFDQIQNSLQKLLRIILYDGDLKRMKKSSFMKRNKIFKYKEMDIFRESFTLLMFDFFTIDSALFMDWIIFLTGYATIISQTNN
ncbi:hypothetical protein DERP_011516 [Dermatophagoides pteronyssinus]|uniref:Gustatory receptor n=1 Tax=Dermatophagoides pteronyssinus TaxID=6956 RepID=A0ABQ8JCN4_DERPT|nr:hypothetical protein DERP_011516 [Dermatophagoides pteronyssinus]